MIDLHTHILPGVDDGVRTLTESVELARLAALDGVSIIVATPHQALVPRDDPAGWLAAEVARVADAAAAAGIAIEIVPGMEAYLDSGLPSAIDRGLVRPLGKSRFILVELPMYQIPENAEQVLFEVQARGYTPIIAHPERNRMIQRELGFVRRIVERDVLLQVTSGSLLGYFGSAAKEAGLALMRSGLVQVLASDAHRPTGERGPNLGAGVPVAARIVGEELATLMVETIPAAILSGEPLPRLPRPSGQSARKVWHFWRRAE